MRRDSLSEARASGGGTRRSNAGWEHSKDENVERVDTERWGRVSHGEIADFYRAVAASGGVVLMTSHTEGFGNVAPEAAACGAWVVAPNVMGLNEAVVDGVTGNLFPADASDDDAAELIAGWMAERRDAQQVSDAARREFAPSVMMDGYQRIYDRREQLVTTPTIKTDDASLSHLREHLAKQRGWRASAARDAAVGLAADGRAQLALGALGIAFRAEPAQFLSGPGFRSSLAFDDATHRHPVARDSERRVARRLVSARRAAAGHAGEPSPRLRARGWTSCRW